jgi:hypothetical protein
MPVHVHRLAELVETLAHHGALFGREAIIVDRPDTEPGTVDEALPVVRAYLAAPSLPEGMKAPSSDSTAKLALALVAGARRALDDVQAIERAAALIARDHGVTVRQLAAAAGITERAATDRYRRAAVTD